MTTSYDEKMFASENTNTPYKDMRVGKWVVRWCNNGKWENHEFITDAEAWLYYYDRIRELKAKWLRERTLPKAWQK